MSKKQVSTEENILITAERVFVHHGYDGTTMKMIADEADINKALLHYYFRNKEKLFEAIFELTLAKIFTPLIGLLSSENSFPRFIELFVSGYIESIKLRPFLPLFILHELQRSPERLLKLMSGSGIDLGVIIGRIEKEQAAGNIKPTDPRQLMVNLLSLCVFPFAARPLLQGVIFENNQVEYDRFLDDRKTEVTRFILDAILTKD